MAVERSPENDTNESVSRSAELRVSLVAPLQASRSGSAAFLGLASDERQYWVKVPNNPQGARGLITERIVYGLGELLGAPTPERALVTIPSGMRWEFSPGLRLRPGLAHGSLNIEPVVEHDEWGTFGGLDHNRERTAAILALWDLCLGEDPQWLHHVSEDMSVYTFDHGLWFGGGADWTLDDLRSVGVRPWNFDLDAGIASAAQLRSTADRLEELTLQDFLAVTNSVPLEWDTSAAEMSALASILYVRVEGVVDRLRDAANHSRHA